jgi:prevent-host-death family protein
MTAVTLPDAQKRLPELLNAARQGDAVEITEDGWTFRLTAVSPAARRPRAGRGRQ